MSRNHTLLNLEFLGDRVVPATLNLTTQGSEGVLNGAIFSQLNAGANPNDPTHTFLTLQERTLLGSIFTAEEGYNTDARPLQFDAIGGPDETRALQLGEAPVIMRDGVAYREFLVTVRQPSFVPTITLDEFRIFVGSSGNLRGYNTSNDRLAGLSASYNLDAGSNNAVRLNDNLNRSATADMAVLIPESVFANATADSYVYVYSRFSSFPGTSVLSGSESWSVRQITQPPPSGGTMKISGFVYNVAGSWTPADGTGDQSFLGGIGGVTIYLLDSAGNRIQDANGEDICTTTDETGAFTFENLAAGTYGIQQVYDEGVPENNGQLFQGNLGGDILTTPETEDDAFLGIVLEDGVNAFDYIFTEKLPQT
jgi:hypothetical protein